MAINLITQAFRIIFRNLAMALRVSLGPFLLGLIVTFGVLTLSGLSVAQLTSGATLGADGAIGAVPFLLFLLFPLWIFIPAWVAVSWHRFVLLEDRPGLLPAVAGRPIWAYVGKTFLLGLLVLLIAIPLLALAGMFGIALSDGAGGGHVGTLIAMVVANVVAIYILQRLAVALPATAVGRPMGFGAAWTATKSASAAIFGVAVFLVLINIIPALILSPVYAVAPILGVVVDVALSWLTLMLGISILTALYGHLVEGRPLPTGTR